jgi:formiminotetrahydrofolate cyclodeaminase
LQVAAKAWEVLILSGEILNIGNRHAASDAAVAGRLSYAAIWGAIYSARTNLALIKDEAFVLASRARIATIIEKSDLVLKELSKNADEITVI